MKNARQLIVQAVRNRLSAAQDTYYRAVAENAGLIAAANVWDQENPDDGVGSLSMNPYHSKLTASSSAEMECRHAKEQWQRAYDLAVDTFLEEV